MSLHIDRDSAGDNSSKFENVSIAYLRAGQNRRLAAGPATAGLLFSTSRRFLKRPAQQVARTRIEATKLQRAETRTHHIPTLK